MRSRSSVRRGRGWGLISFALIATLFLVGTWPSIAVPFSQESAPLGTTALPPEALSWTAGPDADTRALRNPKLDSSLADLAAAAKVSDQTALDLAQSQSLRLSDGRVHVQIVTHAPGLPLK